MSYTFLVGAVVESSAECFADIPASVLSNLIPTVEKSCCNGRGTGSCRGSPSGTTREPLTADPGAGSSMSSPADFRAQASALPATAPGSIMRSPACGESKPESLATFDRATCSLRTRQLSLFAAGCESLATLPRWGMIVGGELYRLPTPSGLLELRALITSASAFGSTESLPTPTIQDANGRDRHNQRDGSVTLSLLGMCRRVPTPKSEDGQFCRPKRMPTPLSRDAQSIKKATRGANSPGGKTLGVEVARIPTPDSRCWKSGTGRQDNGHRPQLEAIVGGQLNPGWVSWLQGWPISWTSLDPMSIAEFEEWKNSTSWWAKEPPIPRVAKGVKDRVARLEAIGDGQVPAVAALAWKTLSVNQ